MYRDDYDRRIFTTRDAKLKFERDEQEANNANDAADTSDISDFSEASASKPPLLSTSLDPTPAEVSIRSASSSTSA